MCKHNRVVHIQPITPPKYPDGLEVGYWECYDCGATFDHNPKEDDEEINERQEVRSNLYP
jgi:hypothetical protein